jgi:MFS family permease
MMASLLMVISCGFTAGTILGGVIAAALLPHAGWPWVFVVGGLLPLLYVKEGLLNRLHVACGSSE